MCRIKKIVHTLSFQIISGFIIVCCLSTTLWAYVLNNQMKKVLLENSINANLDQTKQLAYNLESAIDTCAQTALVLTMDKDVQQAFYQQYNASFEKVAALNSAFYSMARHLATTPVIDSIFLYNDESKIIGIEPARNIFIDKELPQELYMEKITYDTPILANTRTLLQKFQYIGSFTTWDFRYSRSVFYNVSQYMTFTWHFPMTQTLSHDIVTVININERRFRSVYESQDDNGSIKYIADRDGIIVSHPNGHLLKQPSLAFTGFLPNDRDGWYNYKTDDNIIQVTYSAIGNYGLYLIKETPIQVILHDVKTVQNLTAILLVIEIIFITVLSSTLVLNLTSPLKQLTQQMKQVARGNFGMTVTNTPNNEIGALNKQFNEMSISIRQLTELNREIEEQKRVSEFQSLQSYINPHFLYNTLYAFRFMATLYNAPKLADGMGSLVNMLRAIYKNKNTSWTTREELGFIQQYADVMNLRYGGGVSTSFNFPDTLMEKHVLKFLLQPLIENAFLYGISPDSGNGKIDVNLKEEQDMLIFDIRDYGQGIPQDKLVILKSEMDAPSFDINEKGLGISNIHKRIRLYYGDMYGIVLISGACGTKVELRIPSFVP